MENIDTWEIDVATRYSLHQSWLVPSEYGEICPCCKKLRFTEHYISDMGVCVFCLADCRREDNRHENKGPQCQSELFYQKVVH